MPYPITPNNLAAVSGQITENFRPCPGTARKELCMADLAVKRLSGCTDYIPVTIYEETARTMQNHIGQNMRITGRFTSYIYHDLDGSHLNLSLLAGTHTFSDAPDGHENSVFLDGYLCRPPVLRTTPLGRRVTDLTIAVNYPFLESDYIPCICWNKTASAASVFPCGAHVYIWGRIQSREYLKKINEQETLMKTACEVSVWKLEYICK